jgi:hypothetical protein
MATKLLTKLAKELKESTMQNDPFEAVGIGTADGLTEGDSVEIVRVRDGVRGPQAVMLPASIRRKLDQEGMMIVADLQHAVREITKHQNFIDQTVADARAEGLSWATIGWSVGLTAEGARKKWNDPDE